MGYTHYWTINANASQANYNKALKVCNEIVKAKIDILEASDIGFNGIDDQAHEDFVLPKDIRVGFECCKTARKPYDVVVVACLIALKTHLGGGIEVSTDGDTSDFDEGVELFNRVTGSTIGIDVIKGVVTFC